MIRVEARVNEQEVGKRKKRMIADRVVMVEAEEKETAISNFVQAFSKSLVHHSDGLKAMLEKHEDFRLGDQHFRVYDPREEEF